jgi:hypothetical protein
MATQASSASHLARRKREPDLPPTVTNICAICTKPPDLDHAIKALVDDVAADAKLGHQRGCRTAQIVRGPSAVGKTEVTGLNAAPLYSLLRESADDR